MSKILYLTYDGLTDALGQSQILAYLKRLALAGNDISIVSFEKAEAFKKMEKEITNTVLEYGISWHPLSYTKSPPVFSTLYDVYRCWKKAIEINQKVDFEIVHCRGYITAIIGLRLKEQYDKKFIFDMRGWWPDEKLESGHWNGHLFKPVYNYFKKLERKFFKKSDFIVSLTRKGAEEIEAKGLACGEKIGTIPTCVDFNVFKVPTFEKKLAMRKQLAIDIQAKVLVHSGSVGGNYDLQTIIDVFKSFASIHQKSFLLILAKDGGDDSLRQSLINAGIDNFLITQASFTSVTDYLIASDVGFVFYKPSYSTIGRSPTKLGEYWASGLPVISLKNIGDVNFIFEKYPEGGVLLSEDKSTWESEIRRLAFNSPENLRHYARDYFDVEKGVVFYNNIYTHLTVKATLLS